MAFDAVHLRLLVARAGANALADEQLVSCYRTHGIRPFYNRFQEVPVPAGFTWDQLRLPGDELLISGELKEVAHKFVVQNMCFDEPDLLDRVISESSQRSVDIIAGADICREAWAVR